MFLYLSIVTLAIQDLHAALGLATTNVGTETKGIKLERCMTIVDSSL
jgi:hypothetical protein